MCISVFAIMYARMRFWHSLRSFSSGCASSFGREAFLSGPPANTHTHAHTHTHTRNTPHTPQHMSFIGNIAFVCVCVRVCAHVHIGFYLSPSLFLSLYLSIYLSLSISLSLCTTGQRLVWEYFSFSLSQNLLDHSFGITTLAKNFCVYVYVYVYMYVHVYMYVYVYV